ncbi:MAG: hypothetical protein AMDU1_APLC00046G0062 [Thermoplasmatales archaeon A-plasma]|nr:MAG: hypothetical protein AMDU1_APLC00046G0062 [Thermoplasmatales archaeon A-plasma]
MINFSENYATDFTFEGGNSLFAREDESRPICTTNT